MMIEVIKYLLLADGVVIVGYFTYYLIKSIIKSIKEEK